MTLLASELYAISQGSRCKGHDRCHWCGAPCQHLWLHDDLPNILHRPLNKLALCPANHFICIGCWLWRRKQITVMSISNMYYEDRQTPSNHSWLISCEKACSIHGFMDSEDLYNTLLNPPLQFVLSLKEPGNSNHIQCCIANDFREIKADTELYFTINNVKFTYNTYQLEEALIGSEKLLNGKDSGVRELIRLIGPYKHLDKLRKKPSRGKPTPEEMIEKRERTKKVVKSSQSGHTVITA